MTNERIIELLAQREGWKDIQSRDYFPTKSGYTGRSPRDASSLLFEVPDYLHDLNALQPILATLTEEEWLNLQDLLEAEQANSVKTYTMFLLTLKPDQLARCIVKAIAPKGTEE